MFCKNCGAQIADNATFCPKCGAQVGDANTSATQAYVKAGPSIFQSMGSWIKSFFSSNVVSVLKDIAKDESLTGLVGLLFESFLIASFITLLPIKAASSGANMVGNFASMGGYGGYNFSSLVNVPGLYFQNVFIQFFFVVLIMAALLGVLKIVLAVVHKKASVKAIMNIMFYSILPVGFSFGVGFVLTILSAAFGFIVFAIMITVALMMTHVLMYNGFQKLDKFDKSPFYPYMLFGILFNVVTVIIVIFDIKNLIEGLGSLVSSLGNLF